MRRRLLPVCLIAILVLTASVPAEAEGQQPSAASAEPEDRDQRLLEAARADGRKALMQELRKRLERIQAAPRDAHVNEAAGELALHLLPGMRQAELLAGIGPPNRCMDFPGRDETGQRVFPAPCRSATDWFYSLYRLPEGWRGGGPELLLGFDSSGVCTDASWQYTR